MPLIHNLRYVSGVVVIAIRISEPAVCCLIILCVIVEVAVSIPT